MERLEMITYTTEQIDFVFATLKECLYMEDGSADVDVLKALAILFAGQEAALAADKEGV